MQALKTIPTNSCLFHWRRNNIMNNHYGIVSLYCVYSPLKSEAAFFQKSLLWGNKNFSDNFVGGEGGYSKCVESFIDEFSPNR